MSTPKNDADQMFTDYFNQRKSKRIYQRMLTGLQIARNHNREIRFLTFSSSAEKRYSKHKTGEDSNGKPIWELIERTPKDSFDILRARIKRATVKKDGFTGFNLNKYYCLRTSEGNGVLHVVFWGGLFIPQNWLTRNWYEIHGAYEVRIIFVPNNYKKVNGLVGYLLDRYLLNQPIERMSYGWGWAWLGFCKSWKHIKNTHGMLKRGTGQLKMQNHQGKFINSENYQQYLVSFKDRIDTKQPVPVWKCVLWQHPTTSRQTKFMYPHRGYAIERFNMGYGKANQTGYGFLTVDAKVTRSES